jgi:hypothetical protein
MIILFITDSLAFPRISPEKISYEETYLFLLKKKFPDIDFLHFGIGGGTINKLYIGSEYYHETLNPDIVFMQSGIVDCAPRALREIEIQILSRIPVFGKLILNLVKKYSNFLRVKRNIQYTSINEFVFYMNSFEEKFKNIIWIEILPPVKEYEIKVNNIGNNIQVFNDEIKKKAHLSCANFNKDHVLSDYHHLSSNGHIELYKEIVKIIEKKF